MKRETKKVSVCKLSDLKIGDLFIVVSDDKNYSLDGPNVIWAKRDEGKGIRPKASVMRLGQEGFISIVEVMPSDTRIIPVIM
ncbi:MAG TPA: hypothetical protein VJ900_00760 [Patescibacteria group bacterium]|nr:hypothetical protein [Patescibacteria group bacterium]